MRDAALRPYDAQSQVALEGVEVAVAMKKVMSFGDTKCRYNGVDGAANRYPAGTERAMVMRGGKRDLPPDHRAKLERGKNFFRALEGTLGREALQHFGHD